MSILVVDTVNNVLFGIKSNGGVVRPVYNLRSNQKKNHLKTLFSKVFMMVFPIASK